MAAFQVNARVQLQSVYFIGKSTVTTEYSGFIIERLKNSFHNGDYQIIELNAYCEGTSNSEGKSIASLRLKHVLKKLEADSANVSLNDYGTERIAINFEPVHWNRVDIYYTVVEGWKTNSSPIAQKEVLTPEQKDSLSALIHTPEKEDEVFVEIPKRELIPVDTPVAIPLFFYENKGVMKRESLPVLDQLYRTLMTYPELKAHFRGHVCCGHNQRISSKRARYVYRYLKKRGVPKDRISYEGYSNTIPLVTPERTSEDRAKNRRVDVVYTR